ncbi:MAG: histidine--tRNA ligase [Candidatus Omnitrophica bacterium]|nr:histidine--tRNA ligase [Candidatus Omnitrophota bacterium]
MFKRITGTRDILPQEAGRWQEIEAIARRVFSLYRYQEIRPPLIEEALLFNRSLGQSSEIVQKQMFLIKREKEVYALRPEATASVVRAYIENNLDKTSAFQKFYYIGPMFRAERPQKGRLRQFHHIGCEAIGSFAADLDAEIICLADNLLRAFGISGYKIKINNLGCPKDKTALVQALRSQLKGKLKGLCAECHTRFKNNPLRILDCKNQRCQEVVAKLDIHNAYLCPECVEHFDQVKEGLDALKVDYEISPNLVRGLDYYTRTVFEITHPELGGQDAIGAGGRYDNLVAELGGSQAGAVGFAFGVERLLLVTSCKSQAVSRNLIYIISLGEEAKQQSLKLLDNLRKNGIAADTDYENKSLKGALRKADDLGSRFVVIIGEDELRKNTVTLKDMVSGEQRETMIENLINELTTK